MSTTSPPSRRSFLTQPWVRTAIGLTLVLGSLAGVLGALNTRAETTTVLVAGETLVPGVQIVPENLSPVRVPLHAIFADYLTESDRGAVLYVTGPIERGALIPRSSVSVNPPSDDTVVTLALSIGQPAWLSPGATAELWVSPVDTGNTHTEPFVLSPRVLIVAVSFEEGFAANSATSRVEVAVPRRDLPGVIHAIANGFYVTLTPVQGG